MSIAELCVLPVVTEHSLEKVFFRMRSEGNSFFTSALESLKDKNRNPEIFNLVQNFMYPEEEVLNEHLIRAAVILYSALEEQGKAKDPNYTLPIVQQDTAKTLIFDYGRNYLQYVEQKFREIESQNGVLFKAMNDCIGYTPTLHYKNLVKGLIAYMYALFEIQAISEPFVSEFDKMPTKEVLRAYRDGK